MLLIRLDEPKGNLQLVETAMEASVRLLFRLAPVLSSSARGTSHRLWRAIVGDVVGLDWLYSSTEPKHKRRQNWARSNVG